MTRRRLTIIGVVVGVVVVVAGAGAWYFFRGGDEPPPVSLSPTDGDSSGEAPDSLDGTWVTVAGDDANPTFAGYRVTETVLGVGRSSEAVGRTTGVDGSVTISGTQVTEAEFTADLSGLRSDESRRDSVLRERGLETGQFPEATFRLTEPIDLDELPAAGETISVTASGELTLHGETRPISMPLEAVLTGNPDPRIELAGAVEITMSDFGIEPPNVAGFVSVEDEGTIEVHLVLEAG